MKMKAKQQSMCQLLYFDLALTNESALNTSATTKTLSCVRGLLSPNERAQKEPSKLIY